jgi:hypothetical protein
MPKRLSSKQSDPNRMAFALVERIAAKTEGREMPAPPQNVVSIEKARKKNPAAVALGRKGGEKSAAARMEKIAPEERRRIASAAARARWEKEKGDG